MSDIDELVRRTVATVRVIARRATRFATRLFIGVTIVCVGGFLLGVAALSGGIQQVWIVLGIVFGSIAVGGAFLARWRLGSVKRHLPELADEVRSLIEDGTGPSRTVIETFAVDGDGDGDGDGDELADGSAIVLSRQMYDFRTIVGTGYQGSTRMTDAVRAITHFPLLVVSAVAISAVFAFLGFFFLIALAL
jgi:hypothetical protein